MGNISAIHADILHFDARVLATLARLGQTVSRSRLALGIGLLGRVRLCDILATDPRGFLWSDLKWWQEFCFVRSVCLQLAIDSTGWHVRHDTARFTSILDWRATFLAASSSSGMRFPVPKYISLGV